MRGLSIVMPCLNEEITLASCIKKALGFLAESDMPGEIIISDNGSTDNSVKIAEELGAKVVHVEKRGYGSALQCGINAAEYDYVVMGDADDSYDFSSLSGFVEKLDEGYELVMGNRFKGGIEKGAMPFSHRYIGNPFLSGLGRIFFKTKIGDFHCGLRAFRKDSIEKIGLCTTGMEFASEMVVKAVLFNLKIAEIPCKLYPDGRNRKPHLRSIPDGLRHLEFLLIYSPKWLFAYPGLFFSIVGMLIMLTIYVHPIYIGNIEFETTTMFYSAMMMIVGTQLLQFSIFSSVFGERIGQLPSYGKIMKKIYNFANRFGYIAGFIVCVVGLIGIVYTLFYWKGLDFGHLTTTWTYKTAIVFGSTALIGLELLIFTVFIRVLQMGSSKAE